MLGVDHGAPAWARGTHAAPSSAAALAAQAPCELAARLTANELVADLIAALRAAAADDAAMATFFATLGPAGLLASSTNRRPSTSEAIELPLLLRERFVQAADGGDLPAGYGRDLVARRRTEHEQPAAWATAGWRCRSSFHGGDLPGPLVVEAVDEAIVQELAFATRGRARRVGGWTLWAATGRGASLGLWLDFDEPYRGDDLDAVDAQDPMYALLGQLAARRRRRPPHVRRSGARPLPLRAA